MTESTHPILVRHAPAVLTGRGARRLLDELDAAVRTDRPRLVLDLAAVEHLDSEAVARLVRCIRTATENDGVVKLAAPSPQASVVLALTRAARLFDIHANTADAVRSFTELVAPTRWTANRGVA